MTHPADPGPRSVRLIFEYDDDRLRLVHQQQVDVAVTGFDLPREHTPGDHVEVRDADGTPLGRVAVRAPAGTSAEVFPEDPDDPITRTDLPAARGAFTVVVPVTADADHVAVVRVAPTSGRATAESAGTAAVTELASFPLEPR
ncbi:hypothetical protein [Saccharothrix syringae]|uniref:Uncharacterized protein n=1 Tax=Saccharothrix syringae TaxID=103733 RepID=A0A5Q0GVH3_SACSY|nr:hypothetical protein [Saccharothrix syringae]QFZ17470.1 hypothetical protein EKG83_08265 [Saccharothrix syringae]